MKGVKIPDAWFKKVKERREKDKAAAHRQRKQAKQLGKCRE